MMDATSKKDFLLPQLPEKSRFAHKINVSQNLMSHNILANDNLVYILDKHKIILCKEDVIKITLTGPQVIEGWCVPSRLWKIPITASPSSILGFDLYYDKAVANFAVDLNKDNSL